MNIARKTTATGNPKRERGTSAQVKPRANARNSRWILLLLCTLSPHAAVAEAAAVFNETFSNGQSSIANWKGSNLRFWTVDNDGVLAGNNTTDAYGIGIKSPSFRQKDLRATFRFKMIDAKGVQFKLNYSGNGHLGRFIIQPDGFFFQANKNRPLGITEARNFEKLEVKVAPNVWHEFAIELRGETITGTIDGENSKSYQYKHLNNEIGTIELAIMGKSAMFDDVVILPYQRQTASTANKAREPSLSGNPERERSSFGNPTRERGTELETAPHHPKRERRTTLENDPLSNAVPRSRVGLPKDFAWSDPMQPFIESNCYDCHGDGADEGNLDLAALSTDLSNAESMRRWVLVFDRVQKGEMPPKDVDAPDANEKQSFLNSLHKTLTTSHASHREVVLRRLNRAEYENTVNDLFGIDMRLAEMLPEDATKHGFDNNGEALSLSPELIEVYLEAASLAIDRAIGPKSEPKRINISKTVRELVHDNMYNKWFKLFEADGGTVIYSSQFGAGSQLNFYRTKAEGTYRFRLHSKAWQSDTPVMMQIQSGILTRSGNKRFLGFFSIPPEGRVVEFTDYMLPGESIYPRPFGTLKNISSFLNRGERKIEDYDGAGLHIARVDIEGPLEQWPPESRAKLLGEVDLSTGTSEGAKDIFKRFLPRAFRRDVEEQKIDKYADKVAELMQSGRSFEDAIRWTLRAALCSPEFLFLEERRVTRNDSEGPIDQSEQSFAHASGYQEIDDFALANRLSYFLWSSMPDEELMKLAKSSQLQDADVLREQTERMLQSDKSRALTKNFAHQWLDLRDIDATSPDTKLYPEFDEHLKQCMVKESERFFEEVLQGNESVRCFIDSDWVVVNARLAQHYGIDGITGEEFRRVELPATSVRGGVMTQASVLKVTANGANTSPVTRGVWMLEKVMGIHPPPPPPNVPAVVPDVTGANTLRQLLEAHRSEESCNSCHRLIDPPGFALEEFDAIGAWRMKYQFQGSKKMLPVDSTGVTPTGGKFQGVRDYKRLLMKEIDQVAYGLADKLMTYATGRGMGFSDRDELHAIVARNSQDEYRFRDLIHEIVQSDLFRTP